MADLQQGEMDATSEAAARRIWDRICAQWVERAPRFGAVAAHFPRSLRCRRFVASFWAPEVFFGVRFRHAAPEGFRSLAPPFWSPELPEVIWCERGTGNPWMRWGPTIKLLGASMLLLCLSLPASAQTLTGVVSRVSDGDTLVVGKVKVRLFGIDAPEGRQECVAPTGEPYRCGDTAKGFLARLAPPGAGISCAVRAVDRYGRLVGRCVVSGKDLSQWMVRAGWAVAYREYSVAYVREEGAARVARRGMWAGTFVSPETWRRGGGR